MAIKHFCDGCAKELPKSKRSTTSTLEIASAPTWGQVSIKGEICADCTGNVIEALKKALPASSADFDAWTKDVAKTLDERMGSKGDTGNPAGATAESKDPA